MEMLILQSSDELRTIPRLPAMDRDTLCGSQ
jgi:hypothetical protein